MTPEVEIKFACTAGTLEALAARVFTGPGRDRRLVSVYYDTPGDALAARGAALRLRTDDSGRTVQTLKSGTGLARREAEVETSPGRLNLDGDDLRALLSDGETGSLIPRFTVQVRRRACEVLRGGSRIELALDQGEILADGARDIVCEAELELISGDVRDLFALAVDLAADLPLTLSLRSKSDRGYRLAGGEVSVPPPAGLASGEALRRALLSALSDACARIQAAGADPAPEAVHGLRVALRRLRSLLAVFRRRLRPSETTAVRRGLRDLARACAATRELDVLRAAADPAGVLFAELGAARQAAAAVLVRRLEAAPARRVLLDVLALGEAGAWREAEGAAAPAAALAGDLARRWRRIRRLGRRFDDLDSAGRHDLRLRIKALRYALESLDLPQWGGLRSDLVPALRKAQDALGADNDAEAARARLAGLDLTRPARREAERLTSQGRRRGARARAGRAVRQLLETSTGPLT
ncbi:CHAD domain-containing protein [Phenylobacterium sp.]|uniref:CYTH and CHAD domain-containing protein n=1 Tax=Phenylobacterium sp. TaxID=1871053 RepID=UPI0025DF4AC8|nr:CHAD domain-containing protein [Phenylobacterium sp.]MCA3720368.1 CHAD domain-containing protein [Phenylobacterium sp.]